MKNRGSLIISVIFFMMVYLISMGILQMIIMHQKITRSRQKSLLGFHFIHQQLVYYLHHYRQEIYAHNFNQYQEPQSEYFNNRLFPDIILEKYSLSHRFSHFVIPKNGFVRLRIINDLKIKNLEQTKALKSQVFIDLLMGDIPIFYIPFFSSFPTKKNDVFFIPESMIVENDWQGWIKKTLAVNVESINWEIIRQKLKMSEGSGPLPAGIYLAQDDSQVNLIFIQGDVDRMIFSTTDEYQKIVVWQEEHRYEIEYKPECNHFLCHNISVDIDSLFKEIIIVNGSINCIEQENDFAFHPLTNLTLLGIGRVMICSSLISRSPSNVESNRTHVRILCSPVDLFNDEVKDVVVIVDNNGKTVLETTLIVGGKFINKASVLQLKGSLYCHEFEDQGNMEVAHVLSGVGDESFFLCKNVKMVHRFFINYIERDGDEN